MAEITLRAAQAADGEAVAEVLHRARETMSFIPQDLHTMDDTRGFVREVLLAGQEVIVALRDGAVVGFAALDGDMLTQLYVAPPLFGQGTGTRLLVDAMARRPGGLRLWVFQPNAGAIRPYERHGFRTVKETDGGGNEEEVPDRLRAWRPAAADQAVASAGER